MLCKIDMSVLIMTIRYGVLLALVPEQSAMHHRDCDKQNNTALENNT